MPAGTRSLLVGTMKLLEDALEVAGGMPLPSSVTSSYHAIALLPTPDADH